MSSLAVRTLTTVSFVVAGILAGCAGAPVETSGEQPEAAEPVESTESYASTDAGTCDRVAEAGWRRYLGTPAQCVKLHIECRTFERPFANSCGCGCELRDHTP